MSANRTVKILSSQINKNGFIYRLVKRNEDRCLYSQHNKLGEIIAYEVFKIKLGDNRKANERWCALQNKSFNAEEYEELFEIFPSNEEFGKRAWTYRTLKQAEEAFNSK